MKIKFVLIIVLILLISGLLLVRLLGAREGKSLSLIKIGSTSLSVELARTPQELSKGLGGRSELTSDGMLFVLPTRRTPRFWMKDMQFGLDFVWIDGDKVVALTPNVSVPDPSQSSYQLMIYSPEAPITHVLELHMGDIQKYGIKVGDRVEFLD